MRVVVDTNVLVEGLKRKGPCGAVVDGWVAKIFEPCVSTALALEYEDVLTRNRSPEEQERMRRVLQALLHRALFVPIVFTYRPQSPDAGDDFIIDCAMNAQAGLVTSNTRHFRGAAERLWFPLLTPEQFVKALQEQ
ncbi:MAG: PIN domain-containing protein [Deltaproteobacteria bacterium]|nr:PIN domain-containing protein [Deltaproteobacteria bacterium]